MEQDFGGWVARARGAADMTQQQLATAAGVHVNTVKKLEAGETTRVSASVAAKLRKVLAAHSEPDPEQVRDQYDRHTQAALDLIGAWLMRFEEGERLSRCFDITRYVLSDDRQG